MAIYVQQFIKINANKDKITSVVKNQRGIIEEK